jgi:integrase
MQSQALPVCNPAHITACAQAPLLSNAKLLDVRKTADFLDVSHSWVRRHAHELPCVRVGRLVRFDSMLLLRNFAGMVHGSGKSLGEATMQPTQRRYQNGSVFKRGNIKTWFGVFREDVRKPNGTVVRRQRKVRLGTLAELPTKHAAVQELQKHMTLSSKPKTEMTLSELVERWQGAVVPTLKHSTANVYTHSLRSRILPTLGKMHIADIGCYEVEAFLAGKGKVYAKNTLRELRSSLSAVLGCAVRYGWLEKNPCIGVKLPLGTGRKIVRNVLTPEQVTAIAGELEEPYATLIIFLALTGLRIGEAVAVQWADFDGEVLKVQRRIYEGKADTLKTDKSNRSLPIPAALLTRLKTLASESEWVFTAGNGSPVNPGNALRRYVQPVARKLGIKLSGWHDFRHTLATGLINDGVSAKAVSEILGHANVGITLGTYTHVTTENFSGPLNRRAAQFVM